MRTIVWFTSDKILSIKISIIVVFCFISDFKTYTIECFNGFNHKIYPTIKLIHHEFPSVRGFNL
ncbi:hypothetical protein J2772_001694 [Chryseobacterium jejuense]|nr:hypothetical protein [Chryseobacterium jejuense]